MNNIDQELRDLINVGVIKGLRSSRLNRPIFNTRVQLTLNQFNRLRDVYNLKKKLTRNDSILDDLRILRANFITYSDYTKIRPSSFQIAIRQSRLVSYNTRSNGRLTTKFIRPSPYMIIAFTRRECKLDISN